MPDRDAEAAAAAEEKTRRVVGRVVLRKMRTLVQSWEDEEKSAKRLTWQLGLVFFLVVAAALIINFALNAHPKVQLFALALGIGVITAAAMIVWSKTRK